MSLCSRHYGIIRPFFRLILFTLVLILLIDETSQSRADTATDLKVDEDAVLIMTLRTAEGFTLKEDLLVYPLNSHFFVPFQDFCQAVGFLCEAIGDEISGFMFQENWQFDINCRNGSVTWKSKSHPLTAGNCLVRGSSVLISLSALAEIFQIKSTVDTYKSEIFIESPHMFPVQEKNLREGRIVTKPEAKKIPIEKVLIQESRLLDGGFVDLSAAVETYDVSEKKSPYLKTETTQSFELFGMDYLQYFAADGPRLIGRRQNLRKVDNYGRSLFLGLRDVQLLDVETPRIPLVGGRSGRGIFFSNIGIDLAPNFDTHSFRGFLSQNWEVELYHNGLLIGRTITDDNGMYEFTNIPLNFGSNEFKLIYYGPLGQRIDEIKHYEIDPLAAKRGEWKFQFGAVRDRGSEEQADSAALQVDSSLTNLIGISFGLSDTYAIPRNIAATSEPRDRIRSSYFAAGVRGFLPGMLWRLDHAADKKGGYADQLTLKTAGRSFSAGLRYARLNSFVSDWFKSDGQGLIGQGLAYLSHNTNHVIPIYNYVEIKRNQFDSGQSIDVGSHRIGGLISRVYLANEVQRQFNLEASWSGSISANYSSNRRGIRAETGYAETGFSYLNIEHNLDFSDHETIAINLRRDFNDLTNEIRSGYSRIIDETAWEIAAGWRTDIKEFVSLGVASAMGAYRDPFQIYSSSEPLANGTSMRVRIFIDSNRNSVYDAADEPQAGVYVTYNGQRSLAPSDSDGFILVPRIPAYTPTEITVDISSAADPLLHPLNAQIYAEGRRGKPLYVGIPLVYFGEIEGYCLLNDGNTMNAISGQKIRLMTADGVISKETESMSDGFFLFEKIPPGVYILSVISSSEGHNVLPATLQVTVPENGGIISAGTFTAEPLKN